MLKKIILKNTEERHLTIKFRKKNSYCVSKPHPSFDAPWKKLYNPHQTSKRWQNKDFFKRNPIFNEATLTNPMIEIVYIPLDFVWIATKRKALLKKMHRESFYNRVRIILKEFQKRRSTRVVYVYTSPPPSIASISAVLARWNQKPPRKLFECAGAARRPTCKPTAQQPAFNLQGIRSCDRSREQGWREKPSVVRVCRSWGGWLYLCWAISCYLCSAARRNSVSFPG